MRAIPMREIIVKLTVDDSEWDEPIHPELIVEDALDGRRSTSWVEFEVLSDTAETQKEKNENNTKSKNKNA